MAQGRRSKELSVITVSAVDVFCNAVGALACLLMLFTVFTVQTVVDRSVARTARVAPLGLLSATLPAAERGRPYTLYLSARGGSGQYAWSAEDLPAGLRLDGPSGLLTGTPQQAGQYELHLRVRDAALGAAGGAGVGAVVQLRVRPSAEAEPVPLPEARARSRAPRWWAWLGCLVLVLAHQVAMRVLSRSMDRRLQGLLRLHDVRLVRRPDGRQELSGPPGQVEDAKRDFAELWARMGRTKKASYVILVLALIAYTVFLLR